MTKYPELEGLHGADYRRAWNKLHISRMREATRRFRKTEKGKESSRYFHKKEKGSNGIRKRRGKYNVRVNNESRKKATMSRQLWGPMEDALLYSGISQKKLVPILGRSILAIQQRKIRIKNQEHLESCIKQ